MSDLPPGKGHAKHSDPAKIEATTPRKRAKAVQEPTTAPVPDQAKVAAPVARVADLAAMVARFDMEQRQRDYELQKDILRQLKEMNYYLRVLAGDKVTDEQVKKVLE